MLLRSRVRFSTLGDQLFVHSAFPTEAADAVFFGPDTYRFARTIRESLADLPPRPRPRCRVADIGAGSGAGGLYAAALLAEIWPEIVLTDINPRALRFSRVNAVLNGVSDVQIVESDLFDNVDGRFDLIVSNPPYLVDPLARFYRHGGGAFGADLSIRIVEQGIASARPERAADPLHRVLRHRGDRHAPRVAAAAPAGRGDPLSLRRDRPGRVR